MAEEEVSKKSKNTKKKQKIGNKQLLILLSIVFVVWLITGFIISFVHGDLNNRGLFGDSFGMVNSLFSGFAFAGIIYTILLQRKELKYQRDELKLTRKELKKSSNAQIASQKELAKQSLNMKRTAELNALSTLINSLENRDMRIREYGEVNAKNKKTLSKVIDDKNKYIDRVKDILDQKANH
jgi:uncharacterized membrane protein